MGSLAVVGTQWREERRVRQRQRPPPTWRLGRTIMRSLSGREQGKLLSSDVFKLTFDDWMATPGAKKWSEGQGVFVNNYSNFLLWVNLEDQLRMVSVSKGQDLKYVLLRLQKAVARIEEALKMINSFKSCQQRGFATRDGKFVHSRREVYGTGLEVVVTMELLGFAKAGMKEIVKKTVVAVDSLGRMDAELQSRLGVKLTL